MRDPMEASENAYLNDMFGEDYPEEDSVETEESDDSLGEDIVVPAP